MSQIALQRALLHRPKEIVQILQRQLQQALEAKRDAEEQKTWAMQQYEEVSSRWQDAQATLSHVMRILREAGVPYEAASRMPPTDAEEATEAADGED